MYKFIIIFLFVPSIVLAKCDHKIIDRQPRLACVTVKNESNHILGVTSLDVGINLNPTMLEEAIGHQVISCEFNYDKNLFVQWHHRLNQPFDRNTPQSWVGIFLMVFCF